MRGVLAMAAAVAAAGCSSWSRQADLTYTSMDARGRDNAQIVRSFTNDMIAGAIRAQASIFPYHFVAGGSELNELGKRDLSLLAEHLKAHPGRLSVRKAGSPDALYQMRVKTVHDALASAGVDPRRVTIEDAFAGGEGVPTERALVIFERERKAHEDESFKADTRGERAREAARDQNR